MTRRKYQLLSKGFFSSQKERTDIIQISQEEYRRGFSKITNLLKGKGCINKLAERISKGNGRRGANNNPLCK